MRRHHQRLFFFILLSSAALAGCVSVSLPKNEGQRAQAVNYTAPATPFRSMGSDNADQAWVNDQTGNTISFFSDCGGKSDPPLAQLQSESLNVLSGLKMLQEEQRHYNGRQALVAVAEGDVDGVAVKMKLLTLKKNNCNYSLTYTGVRAGFEKDLAAFDQFIRDFKAP